MAIAHFVVDFYWNRSQFAIKFSAQHAYDQGSNDSTQIYESIYVYHTQTTVHNDRKLEIMTLEH